MPEAEFRQEIQTMDDWTLNKTVSGIGGPKVTRNQERTVSNELQRRRLDDMYAAKLADEAQQKYTGEVDSLLNNDAINTLDTRGAEDLLTEFDRLPTDDFDQLSDPRVDEGRSTGSLSNDSKTPTQLSKAEQEALLLIGVILYEAVVLKRTKDTIQASLNDADDLYVMDSTIPRQICEYLWSDLSVNERAPYVNTILGDDGEKARSEIESLCRTIGVEIS